MRRTLRALNNKSIPYWSDSSNRLAKEVEDHLLSGFPTCVENMGEGLFKI